MADLTQGFGSFRWLTGDINYTSHGGKWYRHCGARRYHVMELLNWAETVGERDAAKVGARYNVDLAEVDLDAIGAENIRSALRSCGYTLEYEDTQAGDGSYCPNGDGAPRIVGEHGGDVVAVGEIVDLVLAECCHGYGCRAPLWGENGNNYLRLMREARAYSHSLDVFEAHAEAMEKPVNRIGSTAAEYMRGDISSAILRGRADGKPEADILVRMGALGRKG